MRNGFRRNNCNREDDSSTEGIFCCEDENFPVVRNFSKMCAISDKNRERKATEVFSFSNGCGKEESVEAVLRVALQNDGAMRISFFQSIHE